jgi:hypothetical protein
MEAPRLAKVHGTQAAKASDRPFVTGDQRLQDVELGGPSASTECLTILSNLGLCSSPPAALLTRCSRLQCSSVRDATQAAHRADASARSARVARGPPISDGRDG